MKPLFIIITLLCLFSCVEEDICLQCETVIDSYSEDDEPILSQVYVTEQCMKEEEFEIYEKENTGSTTRMQGGDQIREERVTKCE